jgi:hypothetical protein
MNKNTQSPYGWTGVNGANFRYSAVNPNSELRQIIDYIRETSKTRMSECTKRGFYAATCQWEVTRGWRANWWAGLRYAGFLKVVGRNSWGYIYNVGPRVEELGI